MRTLIPDYFCNPYQAVKRYQYMNVINMNNRNIARIHMLCFFVMKNIP